MLVQWLSSAFECAKNVFSIKLTFTEVRLLISRRKLSNVPLFTAIDTLYTPLLSGSKHTSNTPNTPQMLDMTYYPGLLGQLQAPAVHSKDGHSPCNTSWETQGQVVGWIKCSWWMFTVRSRRARLDLTVNIHHEHFIHPTNCPWVSRGCLSYSGR